MKKKIFWIGIQESEISHTHGLFDGSITIFGSGKGNNNSFDSKYKLRYDYNLDNDLWIEFVNAAAKEIMSKNPDCLFLLYYPTDAAYYDLEIVSHTIALNDLNLLDIWENKFKCREWLCNDIPVIPSEIWYGDKIKSEREKIFINEKKYVVQGEYSCGGANTRLVTECNSQLMLSELTDENKYIVSEFIEHNISVNIHIIVYPEELLILPASIQLISLESGFLEYKGGDFVAYKYLPEHIQNKVQNLTRTIGERLRKCGYLGVCGIDFVTTSNDVYFSEINPRFQSSSFILNLALDESGQEYSLQHLHIDAFLNKKCSFHFDVPEINYSFYKYTYSGAIKNELRYLKVAAEGFDEVIVVDDNLSNDIRLEDRTYIFKLIFKRNISAISGDYKLTIHQNLIIKQKDFESDDPKMFMHELKIMLLLHGVALNSTSKNFLEKQGGINFEEFSALDLTLFGKYYINVPYMTDLTSLSPFHIDLCDETPYLFYFGKCITSVLIRKKDNIADKVSHNGLKYSDFTYKGQDRLRIYHRVGCYFKASSQGCGFCDLENDNRRLSFEDVTRAIDDYDKLSPEIRHYLIGGGSEPPQSDFGFICSIANYIKNKNGKPIYLMSLPPMHNEILDNLKQSGITQVAFNIEIFDRDIAKKYMPGKGKIPLSRYISALSYAVKLWGSTGNVRTIFVVGLESTESLLKGIECVSRIGVAPILSLFRPVCETPLAHLLPPSEEEVLYIVKKAEQICQKNNVEMGPNCRYCEDNTLKITL